MSFRKNKSDTDGRMRETMMGTEFDKLCYIIIIDKKTNFVVSNEIV